MSSALRLSIGANVLLAGIVATLLWRGRPTEPTSGNPSARPPSVRLETPRPAAAPREPGADSDGPRINPEAVALLGRMGISRDVLVSALLEDFHRRWDGRAAGLEGSYAPRPVPEREYVELARLRDQEQVRELKEALGETGYLAWHKAQTLRLLNSGGVVLTAEEAEQVYRLQTDFDQQHKELQMAMEDGVADMADVGTLQAQSQETLDRELAKLIGRKRLDEMRGIADPLMEVARRFGDLQPTPGQAKAALLAEADYRAREAALAGRLKENPSAAADVAAELRAIAEAREQQLRGIFGPAAYDQVQRQNDPAYNQIRQFAAVWELQDHEVRSVYETLRALRVQTERTRTAAALREGAGQRVDWREIDSAIAAAQQQTEAGLRGLIGNERLRRLKQNGILGSR